MTAPERIWAASVTENYGEWQTTTDGLPRPTEYVRADLYAALEAQLAEAKAAMRAVYDWMNQLPIPTTGCTSKMQLLYDALSALEATPAPKVTEERTWGEIPNARTDDAHPVNVLAGVLLCAESWVPEARIIGNVRAGDIARAIRAFEPSALVTLTAAQEAAPKVTDAKPARRTINDEQEVLTRLAAGDKIAFSEDGETAWFTEGDRAFVGSVITDMRSKGYLNRITLDDENYRGASDRDVISETGRQALTAAEEAGKP